MGRNGGDRRYTYIDDEKPVYQPGEPKTWDQWEDQIGNVYGPGDIVAIATISGKSPQLILGEVIRINRVNSKGELHLDSTWEYVECDKDHPHARRIYDYDSVKRERVETNRYHRPQTSYRDSCTVTVQPLVNGRGFNRYSQHKPKPYTYQFWGNIVKIDGSVMRAKMEADLRAEEERLRALGEDVSELLAELAELQK